jgi:hypothetical protein
VTYQDIFGNFYVSIAANDETFIQPINSEFKEIKIEDKTFSKNDFEDFNKLQTQRLHAALYLGDRIVTP